MHRVQVSSRVSDDDKGTDRFADKSGFVKSKLRHRITLILRNDIFLLPQRN